MSNCCRRCIVGVFMVFFIVPESVIASSSFCTKRKQIGAISSCTKVGEKHRRGRWFPNHLEAETLLSLRGGSSAPADVAKSSGVLTAFPDWVGKTTARCWGILAAAILVEIGATSYLKAGSDSGGFSTAKGAKLTALSLGLYLISLLSFGMSLRKIDVSIAYAVWSALGTAVVSVFGILLWGESADRIKIVSLVLIMIGVVGLNLTEGGH
mmetsp:Transcript_24053/g.33615  ORF Transcript_24053/g.33615 Transcript_24053/m.33615 type:complete len:210 (+) Transcript_24053:140-769(+)